MLPSAVSLQDRKKWNSISYAPIPPVFTLNLSGPSPVSEGFSINNDLVLTVLALYPPYSQPSHHFIIFKPIFLIAQRIFHFKYQD